ncbi:MAG: hypothetical protein VR69_01230 [Peptococcaceae bacterium BRH_c4b]|nr:MAG: hypothetical protein VR69_01230 [Peptococcaceae bacterium BRH_c4b]
MGIYPVGEIVKHKMSKKRQNDLLMYSAAQSNILPLTSTCNVRCIFCSHRQNPPDVDSRSISPVAVQDVENMLSFVDPGLPLVIGESVTRIMEGEPFTHPRIREILSLIRKCFPRTRIKITTNGTLLEPGLVEFLSSLGELEITLSLNSAAPENRAILMHDSLAGVAVGAPELLSRCGVEYHGSMVAMPHVTGWEDMARTVRALDRYGARSVRIFLPGHTRYAPPGCQIPGNLYDELARFVERIKKDVAVPVTVEPPGLSDLMARVAGVVPGSPAALVGIKPGDIIESVNGKSPACRVDAFKKVLKAESPEITISRKGQTMRLVLGKNPGAFSGLVMDYDLEPGIARRIVRMVGRHRNRRPLLLTSELGFSIMAAGLHKFLPGEDIPMLAIKNHFFGGSIGCAGLLTVSDMIKAVELYAGATGLLILPAIAFDPEGRDITGCSYMELAEKFSVVVEIIN